MDMHRVIKFETPIDDGLRSLLAESGARPQTDPMGWLMPSPEASAAVEAHLRSVGFPFEIFFEMFPTPGEPLDRLAAYLPLDDFEAIDAVPGTLVLACDEESLDTVASVEIVRLLEAVTAGMSWSPYDGHSGFLRLSRAAELPEPVVVPRAMFLSQGASGRWAVQSDGRELLNPRNLDVVRKAGIAQTTACVVDTEVLLWRRPPIFGGAVLAVLRDQEVNGVLAPPSFLGHTGEG